jgi:hypothetical protein
MREWGGRGGGLACCHLEMEGSTCAQSGGPGRQQCAPGGGGRCQVVWSRGGGGPVGWAMTRPLQWAGPKK